jgi:hypothetical protein
MWSSSHIFPNYKDKAIIQTDNHIEGIIWLGENTAGSCKGVNFSVTVWLGNIALKFGVIDWLDDNVDVNWLNYNTNVIKGVDGNAALNICSWNLAGWLTFSQLV